MTLDEAIIHCQEKSCGDTECSREHKQLEEWLVELKQRREQEEPVSEDLKEFEVEYIEREKDNIVCVYDRHAGLVDGAKWQKQQMMKDAIEAEIINWASMFTSIKVIEPERAETMIKEKFDIGDKVKLVIVKED